MPWCRARVQKFFIFSWLFRAWPFHGVWASQESQFILGRLEVSVYPRDPKQPLGQPWGSWWVEHDLRWFLSSKTWGHGYDNAEPWQLSELSTWWLTMIDDSWLMIHEIFPVFGVSKLLNLRTCLSTPARFVIKRLEDDLLRDFKLKLDVLEDWHSTEMDRSADSFFQLKNSRSRHLPMQTTRGSNRTDYSTRPRTGYRHAESYHQKIPTCLPGCLQSE